MLLLVSLSIPIVYCSVIMAAKGSSFPLLKIQEQLTCGKCHNLYTNPKTLSFHHSFCQQCIEGLPTIPTLFVACPTCHQHTELPDHAGSAGFSVAPQLLQLRLIYDEMNKLLCEKKCDNCSGTNATGYCKDCRQPFCRECIDMHKRWSRFAAHSILDLEEAPETSVRKEASNVKVVLSSFNERGTEIREQGEQVKREIRSFVRRFIEDKLIKEVDEIVDRKLQMLEKQKKESLDTSHEVSEVHPIEKADIQFIKSNNESISHHVGSVVSSAGLEECKVKEITTIKHIPEEKAISFKLSIELPDDKESLLALPASSLSLDVVPANKPRPVINARVIPTDKPGVYQVICNPVIRGHHQVIVRALGVQLKQSSFVIPFNPYTDQVITPIRTVYNLDHPLGVAVHDDGRIVVSEYGSQIVSVLSKEGKKLFGKGTNHITFSYNFGLAITDDGYILVADYGNHRIQKISMDGQHVTSVGSNGIKQLQFVSPTGIAISLLKKRIYIVEYSGNRVQVLNPDLTFCHVFGKEGTGNGEFKNPRNIAIDSEGLVYVADYNNHRIQKFTHDGKYLSQFGNEGTGPGQLKSPSGITIDNAGLVYVSEILNSRVSVFTTDGAFVRTFGEKGINEDQFNGPDIGMTFDKDGLLYISDYGNNRLVVY